MILVDTDVLIAHLRGVDAAGAWLSDARTKTGPLAVSAVSVAEVTGGMGSNERQAVWRLLDTLVVHDVSHVIALRAGELMRRHRRSHSGIGLADYLIAATAEVAGLDLATLNVRLFPMFRGSAPRFASPADSGPLESPAARNRGLEHGAATCGRPVLQQGQIACVEAKSV